MGTVYRENVTRPLPAGAEIIVRKGQRLAKWKDDKGKTRTAPMVGDKAKNPNRIIMPAATYTAKYRDGAGIVVKVSTGCRDADAARRVLAELERRAELVKAGVVTVAENAVADHQSVPLADHFAAYVQYLRARNASAVRIANMQSQFNRVCSDCGFRRLADLDSAKLIAWLVARQNEGMSAAARNGYRESMVMFANWAVKNDRLLQTPFKHVPKANVDEDPRRQRRALTEAELIKLLDVTRRRPLLDAMTIRRGKQKGEVSAVIRDDVRQRLERLGRERALIYKTLLLTGLRRNELATLTIGQLDLDGPLPCIVLDAADEKNRDGSTLPLRSDLAAELALWVKDMQERHSGDSCASEGRLCLPMTALPQTDKLPADTLLFAVPKALVKILDRDLKMAGIAKRDERDKTVDVHSLRHTFGTLLSKGGVAPRTAQAAMRHSSIDLTMNTYTDPRLLDVAGGVAARRNRR